MSLKKSTSTFTASALALAVSGTAQAYNIEAGDTTANIYGYAKLDMIYDVDDKLGNAIDRNAIRLDGEPGSSGHSDLHAFESRLGFTTATPAGGSELKTMVEGDFWGNSGGTFRLRHAYGEWNGILAGQTWTNFGGFLGTNPTIDFAGQPGQGHVDRQAQLRYTAEGFSMALEDPENLGGSVDSNASKSRLPDLTLRYQGSVGDFNYAASGVLRYLEFDDVDAAQKDSTTGWGLALEASSKVAEGVTLRGSFVHGDGIGAYQYLAPVGSPAYVDSNGSVETIKGTGGTAGVTVAAGPGNVSLGYGIATVDLDDAVADDAMDATANEKFEGVFLNYIWSPIRSINYGVEAGYHSRKQVDGDKGSAVRIQGMVQYSF